MSDAATVLERCARLGEISEEPDRLARRFATPAMRAANGLVAGWMGETGMAVREDAVGNLIGRHEAQAPGARALVLGSHLDTVLDAGRYDGPLGVLAGLAVVERLGGHRLPFAIEVVGLADEEGVRYGTAFLGSSAMAGRFEPAWLDLLDAEGVTLAEALRAFGGDPERIASAARRPEDLLGYCELHIEQGPVLERHELPVGVVSAITAQRHGRVRFQGEAGHAGTIPMDARRDALCAAAEWILAVEELARGREGLVGTVGAIEAAPGARNVIPSEAVLTLDLRHPEDAPLADAMEALAAQAESIAAARGVSVQVEVTGVVDAVAMASAPSELLAGAVEASGVPVLRLPSGAGHDAAVMAGVTPAAMLFVRCAGGISHSPAESVAEADVAVALEVIERFVHGL